MSENNVNVLVKSEKIPQTKKKAIVWAIFVLLVILSLAALFIDYSGYKKGQEFGLKSASLSSTLGGAIWINENDSYAEQCKDVYYELDRRSYDVTINGKKIDYSAVRKSENAMRSAFYDVMKSGGFDRFSSYDIADWFKYTSISEYAFGYYSDQGSLLPYGMALLCFIALLVSIFSTVSVNREAKKELIVYEDSVLCRSNSRKTTQLLFQDINNVDFGKNTLKLAGTGVNFKIANLTNAESIQSVIMEKKKSYTPQSSVPSIGNTDDLRKLKELLDCGIITQDEFDAKKKQILGL